MTRDDEAASFFFCETVTIIDATQSDHDYACLIHSAFLMRSTTECVSYACKIHAKKPNLTGLKVYGLLLVTYCNDENSRGIHLQSACHGACVMMAVSPNHYFIPTSYCY